MAILEPVSPDAIREAYPRRLPSRIPWRPALVYRLAIGLALALGLVVRAVRVLAADFPLNDGGLFFVMARDIQRSGYRLPELTTYNAAGIPFSYPPLGFYLAALLDQLTPLTLIDTFRIVPLVATCLTVVAFALLARAIVDSRLAVAVAIFAFALAPRSFVWLLMGGGLTRSLGLLFALLALHQVYRLYTRRESRYLLPAAVLSGLTLLSRLETGAFLAYSIALFWLFLGRHRHGLFSSAALAAGALAVSAPWWGAVLWNHGAAPFVAAAATGGSVFSGAEMRTEILWWLARFGSISEPLFPVTGALALLGTLVCLKRRQFLLPAWWATIILMDWRAFKTFTTVPVAMLAGIGIATVLIPLLRRDPPEGEQPRPAGSIRLPHAPWPGGWAAAALLAFLLVYATFCAVARPGVLHTELAYLDPLSVHERAAMAWVARETPPGSRFLILSGSGWPTDKTAEWFPLLAARTSVATVQGFEWLPDGAFNRHVRMFDHAQWCGGAAPVCLESWVREWSTAFTHLYVSKTPDGQCCRTLLFAIDDDPRYHLVYDGPGATVFLRYPSEAPDPATRAPR